ncbi:MAG: response regulator [Deltaproteobacteria bacterium]|nr:response regulator [Deltaproteobacteria bacterium]MBW2260094.1 response regulator [Deltaproteobacteria bacterium]
MGKFKVLLVDDEIEFVQSLAERLSMRELGTDTVYDGEGALSFVRRQEPDVMVLDLKMPGIDGMEVLRQVKKAYPTIQVIILTGHGTKQHEDEARRIGAFDYMEKPVDIEMLVSSMKAAYRHKIETTMTAAAFAEAGNFDTAKNLIKEE